MTHGLDYIRSSKTGAMSLFYLLPPYTQTHVYDYGHSNNQADEGILNIGVGAEEHQPGTNFGHDEGADKGADDAANAPGHGRAPDDGGGDRLQLDPGSLGGRYRLEEGE